MALQYADHRADPVGWAQALGVSTEAVALYLDCEVIDLQVDSFIWTRTFGYDLRKRHGRGPFGGRFLSQVDLPRIREAAIGGALWSITTNPWRGPDGRAGAFDDNLAQLTSILASVPDDVALVDSAASYRAARAAGKHGAFLAVQGGNAVDRDEQAIEALDDSGVVAVTLVHLSRSRLGQTSAPGAGEDRGLTDVGRRYVEALDARRIFVDLAHIGRKGFFDAVEVHDRSLPLIVTHTGVSGVTPRWRNIDDEQLRAVADTGGTVGIIFHGWYLGGGFWRGGSVERIVDHVLHVVQTVGEDHVSLGSDWDGMIVGPGDMRTCLELPRLVQAMLERGCSDTTVRKLLGENYLRALAALRD
jgi:membrane dipeptidase